MMVKLVPTTTNGSHSRIDIMSLPSANKLIVARLPKHIRSYCSSDVAITQHVLVLAPLEHAETEQLFLTEYVSLNLCAAPAGLGSAGHRTVPYLPSVHLSNTTGAAQVLSSPHEDRKPCVRLITRSVMATFLLRDSARPFSAGLHSALTKLQLRYRSRAAAQSFVPCSRPSPDLRRTIALRASSATNSAGTHISKNSQ